MWAGGNWTSLRLKRDRSDACHNTPPCEDPNDTPIALVAKVTGLVDCPVCGSTNIDTFLRRYAVPVHQNLVLNTQDEAECVARGDLDMVACGSCGLVFNAAFDPDVLLYGENYDNTQHCSAFFSAYMDDLVREFVVDKGVRNRRIVEVGCGKGSFLRRLIAFPDSGNTGIGFDPSYIGPEADLEGRLSFRREYYGPEAAAVRADVVVCRHVIEHVPNPLQLLRSVRQALQDSESSRVFFETPCVEWILENQVLWDLFYEHCSLFSVQSLEAAFQLAGFAVMSIEHRFMGQYLWIEARPARIPVKPRFKAGKVPGLAADFGRHEAALKRSWLERVAALREQGGVALWGAGAKGCTFANLIDADRTRIDCVVDLNPAKHHKYVPGSGHPIVPYEALASRQVRWAILMNPNYRAENEGLLRAASIDTELIE